MDPNCLKRIVLLKEFFKNAYFTVCKELGNNASDWYFYESILYICFQHHVDPAIGVYVIDRYTYYALEFLESVKPGSKKTMGQFVSLIAKFQGICWQC